METPFLSGDEYRGEALWGQRKNMRWWLEEEPWKGST
jgi:hypothetical protein